MANASGHGRKLQLTGGEKFQPLYQPYRHKALYGGRGGGKSHGIGEALVVHAMMGYERIVGARQFQNSISESSKALIESKIRKLGVSKAFKILEREIVHEETDSRFTFIGLERNPESVKSLEGCTKCWVEEARMVKSTSMDILIPTIRTPGSEIWWSWNPKFKADPIDAYFRGPMEPPRSYIQEVSWRDNPWFYLTEMPAEKAHMYGLDKKKYEHIWEGKYDDTGEARIFNNTRVGRIEIPEFATPLFGMDFGFANDPNALIKLYVMEATKQIYIAQEAFGRVPLNDLCDLMATVTESNKFEIVADSSRPETIDYINGSGKGYFVTSSRKGAGSIKTGIEFLQGYEIIIDPDCVHMQDEALSYSWKVDERSEKILPIPLDTDNHGWDAVRYALERYRDGQSGGGKVSRGGV